MSDQPDEVAAAADERITDLINRKHRERTRAGSDPDEHAEEDSPTTPTNNADDGIERKTGIPGLIEHRIMPIVDRVMKLRPVRVYQHFGSSGGPLIASGMSYQALFAVFAAIWVGFSVAGFVLDANKDLQNAVIGFISDSVPGLIGPEGAIDPQLLLETRILGWTGALALLGLLSTALGWLASTRDAIRRIFEVPHDSTFFLLLKLKDLGLAIGFGIAVVVSAALTVVSTSALSALFSWAGIEDESMFAIIAARVSGLILVFLFDTSILVAFYRILSGIPIPFRRLLGGALLGAAALGVLKVLGSSLLGGATSNPLLASFAVIIGLLIWFNLICQVILIGASWIAVGLKDDKIDVRGLSEEDLEKERAVKEAAARAVVARSDRARLERESAAARGFKAIGARRRLVKATELEEQATARLAELETTHK
jgi:membrane protein